MSSVISVLLVIVPLEKSRKCIYKFFREKVVKIPTDRLSTLVHMYKYDFSPYYVTYSIKQFGRMHSATGCLICDTLTEGIFLEILRILSNFNPKKLLF